MEHNNLCHKLISMKVELCGDEPRVAGYLNKVIIGATGTDYFIVSCALPRVTAALILLRELN